MTKLQTIGLLISLLTTASAFPQGYSVESKLNVPFCKGGKTQLYLDAFRPITSSPRPAVLVVHGGAWIAGERGGTYREMAKQLAAQGYFAVTIDYRLALPWKSTDISGMQPAAPFPAAIEDVKCAMRYVRANSSQLNVDPARIAQLGFSAGGHLTSLASLSPTGVLEGTGGYPGVNSRPVAFGSWVGPGDLIAGYTDPVPLTAAAKGALILFLGGTPKNREATYKVASPQSYASSSAPPSLLIHGTEDELVSVTQSINLNKALVDRGAQSELQLIEGATHGFPEPEAMALGWELSYKFLNEQLKP